MPLFALMCLDKPNSLDLRMATRERHLAYVGENMVLVKVAGPVLNDDGGMAGSLFILEAQDKAQVEAFHAADPYTQAGLWGSVTLKAFRATVGQI